MEKVVRFGVSMEENLLDDFDQLIKKKGYTSRSEALRDLVRKSLIEEKWEDPNADVLATVSILYCHSEHHLAEEIADLQHKNYNMIISTTHVHLDKENCLEVILLKGKSSKIKKLAETLYSAKGVKHGGVVFSSKEK